ncbi:phosphate signaling complex protein PhoU [Methanofollis formosanus]|uniref:Phosphate-specific transport system accessory protein PhoU n=1 Tax=Methanofollis formosanus TaxID=299308 RepID=A0A8G1EGV1_9EURY|nr:phosphate signaling complex protein PhoU [Methanofollis formosanus]QYZ80218.1 phosphate signaling complex protein PhoU [Methanofollis formosanus]
MSDKFHEELDTLRDEFLEYGHFARGMLVDAFEALKNGDEDLAGLVLARKDELARRSDDFDERLLTLIALYQPMAQDLRAIICTIRMNASLYRIGRYGKDIALLVPPFAGAGHHLGRMLNLPHMAGIVVSMVDDVLKAYETRDVSPIEDLSARDDCVDDLRYSVFREALTYMMEDPRNIERGMDYVMVARYLERCGDHCCSMGEKVHFMLTGERIEIK